MDEINLALIYPDIPDPAERCSLWRYSNLEDALTACDNTAQCGGVTADDGLLCKGHTNGTVIRKTFELRSAKSDGEMSFVVSWKRQSQN